MKWIRNPKAGSCAAISREEAAVRRGAGRRRAFRAIRAWPEYEATPLLSLDDAAQAARVGSLWVKDESRRFGLGSFKGLGAAYGVQKALEGLKAPLRTVACATEGNHGAGVAWGAARLGAKAVVFLPSRVSRERARAIQSLGARVVWVNGEYDDAVALAASTAEERGWIVVSDTAYAGYMELPAAIMQGYAVLASEALNELPEPPTHVFVQAGVGGFAASALAYIAEVLGGDRPTGVVVEPSAADCLFQSARQGRPSPASGDLKTVMGRLGCRYPSLLAWPILESRADFFMTISDAPIAPLMRSARRGELGSAFDGGESGVAGLAGALEAAALDGLRTEMGLDESARVLVFNTEGALRPT